MANAKRDQNNVPTLLAVLESDGETLIGVEVNPLTNNSLSVDDNTTGSDNGPSISPRDDNYIPAIMAVSSADGVTPIVVYATADGKLLIDSN